MLAQVLLALVAAAIASASDVLDLDDANFQSKASQHDIVLVEFFAPWCGHCKRLAPEYEKAATALKANDPPVPLAKVDCTANSDLCSKYGVSGYPTLKIFRSGEFSQEYQGPREADGIVKYMRSQSGPSSKELKNVEDYEKFIDNAEHGIIGFFKEESKLKKAFLNAANTLREEHRFAHSSSEDVLKVKGSTDTVVIQRPKRLTSKFEDNTVAYDGSADETDMKAFIKDKLHGLAGHRTSGNTAQFKPPVVVVYYDVDYVKNPKGSNYWRNRVMKVAQKFEGKDVRFAVANSEDFQSELEEFGLEYEGGKDAKPVVGARDAKNQKYPMSEAFSMDNLEKFVTDLVDGNMKPYLKSEPIPSDNDMPGKVKVAVAENFEELVADDSKDVLIEFYAPWCGHCKNLAPKYDELAEKMKDESSVVIAKMDATANDVPSPYEVRGFPTIYFKAAGKQPTKYEGGREVDDFVKFLAKQSTDELTGFDRSGNRKKSEL